MKLQFTDGISFETSGRLRIERRRDGLYVVGEGHLCAVKTHEDGERMIEKMLAPRREHLRCEYDELMTQLVAQGGRSVELTDEIDAIAKKLRALGVDVRADFEEDEPS